MPPVVENTLHVFRIDVETGIELVSVVDHPSEVRRSVRVGESLISVSALFREAATGANRAEFDLDGNALVNEDDVEFVVHAVLETEYGDADLDGDVDFDDFLALSANFGKEGGWASGDFDGDGLVTFSDFTILAEQFGR